MRAVVQRVRSARVTVDEQLVGSIGHGLLVFLGVASDDGPADASYIATKVRGLRVFEDDEGRMNRSVVEAGGAILVVSQFTLYGDCRKGRRPSFDAAAAPALAQALYEDVVRQIQEAGSVEVSTGAFRERMHVELLNDGPVTLLLESRRQF